MNPQKIADELKKIEDKLSEKGYYRPKVVQYVGWLSYDLTINIAYRIDAHSSEKNIFIHLPYSAGFEGCIAEAYERIDDLPSIEDERKREFIAAVGKLIDQGRDIGVDVDFLNPLTDMMKSLSSNIITKQKIEEEVPF